MTLTKPRNSSDEVIIMVIVTYRIMLTKISRRTQTSTQTQTRVQCYQATYMRYLTVRQNENASEGVNTENITDNVTFTIVNLHV